MRQLVERFPRVDEFFRQQSPFNNPDYFFHSIQEGQLSNYDRRALVTLTYHETHDGQHSIWVIPPVGSWWEVNPKAGVQQAVNPGDVIVWISTTKLVEPEPERTVTVYPMEQDILLAHDEGNGQTAAELDAIATVFSH